MKSVFDAQEHFNAVLEIESIVCYASMLCEGMYPANGQMEEKQYMEVAAGAFYMLNVALEKAHGIINDMEGPFKAHHGTKWPCELKA